MRSIRAIAAIRTTALNLFADGLSREDTVKAMIDAAMALALADDGERGGEKAIRRARAQLILWERRQRPRWRGEAWAEDLGSVDIDD